MSLSCLVCFSTLYFNEANLVSKVCSSESKWVCKVYIVFTTKAVSIDELELSDKFAEKSIWGLGAGAWILFVIYIERVSIFSWIDSSISTILFLIISSTSLDGCSAVELFSIGTVWFWVILSESYSRFVFVIPDCLRSASAFACKSLIDWFISACSSRRYVFSSLFFSRSRCIRLCNSSTSLFIAALINSSWSLIAFLTDRVSWSNVGLFSMSCSKWSSLF